MDSLITWNGKLLTPITSDHAFRVRCDVQLYRSYAGREDRIWTGSEPEWFRMNAGPYDFHNKSESGYWKNYRHYIEVDPPKPEYTPEQRSCDQARKRDREVRP